MQPDDTTVRIPLRARDGSVRAYALVDASDIHIVIDETWRLHTSGYACRWISHDNGQRECIWMHYVILGITPAHGGDEVDHIGRDRADNRRANLRVVPHSGNMQNRPSHRGGTSVYRGVSWDPAKKRWLARVKVNGKDVRLGRFLSEEEAGHAARAGRTRLMPYAID